MLTQTITKENWRVYFDLLTKVTFGRLILLEHVGENIGDQFSRDWSPFESIRFDDENDALYLCTPAEEHQIMHPKSVVIQDDGRVKTIGIWDIYGDLQIIHFREPLLLETHFSG